MKDEKVKDQRLPEILFQKTHLRSLRLERRTVIGVQEVMTVVSLEDTAPVFAVISPMAARIQVHGR